MYCIYCGNQIGEKSNFCPKCGKEVNVSKKTNVGRGKSIASMVLGIVSVVWSFFELLALEDISSLVNQFFSIAEFVGGFIGFNLLSLPTAIVGLILGIQSKENSNKRKSGIIMCSISLFVVVISLILMLVTYVG